MALRLAELNPDTEYEYVCTPTGNELEELFEHWKLLGDLLGKRITPVVSNTLERLIDEQKMIPNFRARFCTRMLKIEPYAAWLMQQSRQHEKIISYVGIRHDEPERQAGDYTDVPNVEMRFPLREWEWGLGEVVAYLEQRGIEIPKRTDCALCFYQRLSEWWDLWRDHPEEYQRGVEIEKRIGYTFRSDGRDTWPADLESLRHEFERGRTPRGATTQQELFKTMQCRVCRL